MTALTPTYPLPPMGGDSRFSLALIVDVVQVLTEHGYPPITAGGDIVALQQALHGFLYAAPNADPTGSRYSDHADRMAVDGQPVPDTVRGLAVDDMGEFGVVHPAVTDETPAADGRCPEPDCRHPLARHDEDGCCLDCHCHPGCKHRPVAGGPVDEDERCPVCGESLREIERGTLGHIPGEACAPVEMAASGLTLAADRSRGVLAGTTPVVTYFSFGHGQTDPSTGAKLLDHYVTVVAPTYEACREAMFASRFGRAWSFDYLAGTARATEWIPQWTEHEVIVAAGTNPTAAQAALQAAADVLTDEMPF